MEYRIRGWHREDAESLSKSLNNNKIHINLRDGLPLPYTLEDAREYIEMMLSAPANEVFAWAVDVDGKAVGSIGIFRKDNIHRKTAEIGYYIAEPYWGNGIMTECVGMACTYIFEKTDIVRIFGEPFADNVGSSRVLEKSGFQLEGILRKNAYKDGQIKDMKMYARIREEADKIHN